MAIAPVNRPKGRSVKSLRMVWGFATRYPGHIGIAALALLVAAAATNSIPWGFKFVIDKGFGTGASNARAIAPWFELLLAVVAVLAVATAVRYYFVSWLGERTVADIRLAVHRNLLRMSPGFFEENRPAEITSRITVDTTIIEQVVGTTVSVALRNSIMGIGCVVTMFILAPKLAGLMLLGIPLVLGPIVASGPSGARHLDQQPEPDRRGRDGHHRSARRDEDRAGVQPAAARGGALRRGGRARVRDRQAPHRHPRGHDRDDDLPDDRRDRDGHLARRDRRCRGPDERRHDRRLHPLRRPACRRVRRVVGSLWRPASRRRRIGAPRRAA